MRQLKIKPSKNLICIYPPPNKVEIYNETVLINKVKVGDKEALKTFVRLNLRLIVNVAKQYQNHGLSMEELANEGKKGLLKALDEYDESKGFKFISYAVWWIRQSMIKAIEEKKEGRK